MCVCFFNSRCKTLTTRKHLVQVGNKTTFPPSLDIAFEDITPLFFCEEPGNKHAGPCGFCCSYFALRCNTAEDVGNKRTWSGSNNPLTKIQISL